MITSVKGGGEIIVLSNAGSSNYVLKAGEKVGQLYGNRMIKSLNETNASGVLYIPVASHGNYTVASNGWVVNKATKQPYFTPNQYSFGDPNPKFNISFINVAGKRWVSHDHVILAVFIKALAQRVFVIDVWVVDAVHHQVHETEAHHGGVYVKAIEAVF